LIPLRDSKKSSTTPLVCYLFIAANAAVFIHELSLGDQVGAFVDEFGLVPWKITRGISRDGFSFKAHVVSWFSSMFVHGGWIHLLGNMWFLRMFGDNVEDRLGKGRFFVLYISGGLIAGLAQVISSPSVMSPMIGASGAVSTILAAYLVLYPRARILTLIPVFILFYFVQLPAFIFIGLWFFIQLLYGYVSLGDASGGVAWWAHIGGFAAGIPLVLILKIGTTQRPGTQLKGGKVNIVKGLKKR